MEGDIVARHCRRRGGQKGGLDRFGQLQVVLQYLLLDKLLVDAGIVDGDGHHLYDGLHQLLIRLGEIAMVVVNHLTDADQPAAHQQGRADHVAGPEPRTPVELGVKTGIGIDIGQTHGLPLFGTPAGDAAAHGKAADLLSPSSLSPELI